MNRKSLGFFLLLLLFLISAVVWRQKLFLIIPIIMILTGILTFAYAKLATTNLNAELKFTNVVDKGKNVTGKIIVRISRKIRVAEKFIKSIHLLSRRVFVIIVGTFNRICTRQIRSCGLTLQMHKFIFFSQIFPFREI